MVRITYVYSNIYTQRRNEMLHEILKIIRNYNISHTNAWCMIHTDTHPNGSMFSPNPSSFSLIILGEPIFVS